MTAKEKALELVEKFRPHAQYWDCYNDVPLDEPHAVQCAIIAVDEIITTLLECEDYKDVNPNLPIGYYKEVKQELEKML